VEAIPEGGRARKTPRAREPRSRSRWISFLFFAFSPPTSKRFHNNPLPEDVGQPDKTINCPSWCFECPISRVLYPLIIPQLQFYACITEQKPAGLPPTCENRPLG